MRPDTEPNKHAKRIIAGAAVLTAGLLIIHGYVFLAAQFTTIALGIAVIMVATVVCYVIGLVTLDVAGGGV